MESSNSWDSSLASPHKPSFLNNFLQSESFVDCNKHLLILQIVWHFFSGLLWVKILNQNKKREQGLVFPGFRSHVSYYSCTSSLSVHPHPTFVVKSTIQSLTLRSSFDLFVSKSTQQPKLDQTSKVRILGIKIWYCIPFPINLMFIQYTPLPAVFLCSLRFDDDLRPDSDADSQAHCRLETCF